MSWAYGNYGEDADIRWTLKVMENAAMSAAITTAVGYLLNVQQVIQISNPLQCVIYGVTVSLVDRIGRSFCKNLERDHRYELPDEEVVFAGRAIVAIAVSAAVVTAAGFPMAYYPTALVLYLPAFASHYVAKVIRHHLADNGI